MASIAQNDILPTKGEYFEKLIVYLEVYCRNNKMEYIYDAFYLCALAFTNTWKVMIDGAGNCLKIDTLDRKNRRKLVMYRNKDRIFMSDLYFKEKFSRLYELSKSFVILNNSNNLLCYMFCVDDRLRAYDLNNHQSIMPMSVSTEIFVDILQRKNDRLNFDSRKYGSTKWPGTTSVYTFTKNKFKNNPSSCIKDDLIRNVFINEIG